MAETIVQLRNANIYQGQHLILHQVDLEVRKGEFVYLVGKTGTGKSSLLKTLYGELPLTSGEGWVAVELKCGKALKRAVTLKEIKADPQFAEMQLVRIARLSVQKVEPEHWKTIRKMGGLK